MNKNIVFSFLIALSTHNLLAQNSNQILPNSLGLEQIKNDPNLSTPLKSMHDITIYPSIANMTKNVIIIDPMPNESMHKVEFYAVKSAEVDDCNKHYLLGEFEVKTLEGYGYPYYIFKSNSQIISTKMGCENQNKKVREITSGKTELVRYISSIPIVVYTPKEIDVKYKLWKQESKEYEARSY